MDCHAQTVRDRCARGEIPFSLDASTGHRRIDARHLEALGYDLTVLSRHRSRRRAGFHASLTAEVEGRLDADAAHVIAEQVVAALADRDVALAAAAENLGEARAALRELAAARFWQRRRILARLRATPGLLADAGTGDARGARTPPAFLRPDAETPST